MKLNVISNSLDWQHYFPSYDKKLKIKLLAVLDFSTVILVAWKTYL